VKIVAVTSCPTGIAHTYMAAEALEKAARARGHEIFVETQGSGGADTASATVIAEADVFIRAADATVRDPERFAKLPKVEVGVAEAINKTEEVLDRAEQAAARGPATAGAADAEPTVTDAGGAHPAGTDEDVVSASAGAGSEARRWLMTGVSYMIPFVTAGGILIALAFALGGAVEVTEASVFEEFTIARMLMEIGGTAFGMLVPILAGFIAYAMADRPGIAPGVVGGLLAVNENIDAGFIGGIVAGLLAGAIVLLIKKVPVPASLRSLMPVLVYPLFATLAVGVLMITVVGAPLAAAQTALTDTLEGMQGANAILLGVILGAMMAFDMGGPVNKVAYAFGLGAIAEGIFMPHAAIMAAGMTPPLGLALATVLAKKRYNPAEREAGKAAWVMGASFITEGAIPFAAADPLRVIPALIIGSATAGGLSMAFGATLQAPHGGLFVVGLVGNAALYLLAIVIGTVVTAVTVNLLKSIGRPAVEPMTAGSAA
jgi:fructose PTS system EIIBC or EIIC component